MAGLLPRCGVGHGALSVYGVKVLSSFVGFTGGIENLRSENVGLRGNGRVFEAIFFSIWAAGTAG